MLIEDHEAFGVRSIDFQNAAPIRRDLVQENIKQKNDINSLEPLSDADRALAEAQVICPVTEVRLGSMGMGTPIKLDVEGRTVFICCEGCRSGMVDEPEKYFAILDDYLSGKVKVEESSDDGAANQSGGNEEPYSAK